MRHFTVILLLLAVPVLCSAEIYKWVNEKGQTGYSDDLGKVPKKYRDKAIVTEKEEQAVEIIEKSEPEKSPRKGAEGKNEADNAGKGKDKPLFDGTPGEVWKLMAARYPAASMSPLRMPCVTMRSG